MAGATKRMAGSKLSKHGRVYDPMVSDIRADIAATRLRPGDRILSELELAEMYGISRISVRAGLRQLIDADLIASVGRQGYFVTSDAGVARDHPDPGTRVGRPGMDAFDDTTIRGTHIVRLNAYSLAQFMQEGLLVDLHELAESSRAIRLDKLFPALLHRTIRQGSLSAIPIGFSPVAMLYNRDLFDECRVPRPDESWTWQDVLTAASRLELRDRHGWLQRRWGKPAQWPVYVWQAGAETFDEARHVYCFDTEAAYEGLLLYRRLAEAGFCYETNMLCDDSQEDVHFLEQRSAVTFGTLNDLGAIRRQAAFPVGVAPMPQFLRDVSWVHMTALGIRADAPDPQREWRQIEAWAGAGKQREDYRQFLHYPSVESLAAELLDDDSLGVDNQIWLSGLREPRFVHGFFSHRVGLLYRHLLRDFVWPTARVPSLQEVRSFLLDLNLKGHAFRRSLAVESPQVEGSRLANREAVS